MMAEKTDRRIRKTKAQLRRGLAKLLKEKTIKEITVKELVEEVDINRSTFYLHYTDIYDLQHKIVIPCHVVAGNDIRILRDKLRKTVIIPRMLEADLHKRYHIVAELLLIEHYRVAAYDAGSLKLLYSLGNRRYRKIYLFAYLGRFCPCVVLEAG